MCFLAYVVWFAYSAFNAHALGALAEVAGPGLDFHLGTILPALLAAMGDGDEVRVNPSPMTHWRKNISSNYWKLDKNSHIFMLMESR